MNLQELDEQIKENLRAYIYGWGELAKYFDVSIRTLTRWHVKRPIPWQKAGQKKNSSVRIHIIAADHYYDYIKNKVAYTRRV